jgi:hypothetical protein
MHLLRRKADSAASGHYAQAGFFLRVVGRALVFARSQPLSLALTLLLLLFGAAMLLRFGTGGGGGGAAGNPFARGGGSDGGGGGKRANGSVGHRRSGSHSGTPRAPTPKASTGETPPSSDGAPGCIVHATAPGDGASAPLDDGASSAEEAAAAAEPTPVVHGPIAAPIENPGVVRGVARLLSRAGRDDAAADVAEVFSVLAGDFLGRGLKAPDVAAAGDAAAAQLGAVDRDWALDGYDLNAEASDAAFVEEVFENSRYMPLQGWGSSYPGHLLPTDRRRWSRFDAAACADTLRELVFLPSGWAWAGVWKKDMRGAERGAVDSEGWSYAVDFKVRLCARSCARVSHIRHRNAS